MGYWGTLVAAESGTTFDEYLAFMEIAAVRAQSSTSSPTSAAIAGADGRRRQDGEGSVRAALVSYRRRSGPRPPPTSSTSPIDRGAYRLALILSRCDVGLRLVTQQVPAEAIAAMGSSHRRCRQVRANPPPARPDRRSAAALQERRHHRSAARKVFAGLIDCTALQWMGTSAYDSFGDRVPRYFKLLPTANGTKAWSSIGAVSRRARPRRVSRDVCRPNLIPRGLEY